MFLPGVGGIEDPLDPCSALTLVKFAANKSGDTEKV
jgi:hypothetical protein